MVKVEKKISNKYTKFLIDGIQGARANSPTDFDDFLKHFLPNIDMIGLIDTDEEKIQKVIVKKRSDLSPKKKGGKKKKILVKKIVRKHRGIIQAGGNKGRLRKGYKYTGKKLKSGLPQIIKCRINKF